jgi:glycosyltransferase involved in cell wall biosynthesis
MVVRLFYPWVGGAERQAHKLAQHLKARNIEVEIVTGWWFRGTPQREILDGIPVFRNQTLWEMFGVKGLRKFGGYLYIGSLLWHLWRRRTAYDVLHIHGLNYHTFAAVLAGRWFRHKTLTKVANSGPASDILKMRRNQQLLLARYMLPTALCCDRFVAINDAIVQELTAAGVPASRIVKLANGVETDDIPAKANYTLHDPPRLIFVGRLHYQKGIDVLLKAFQALVQQHPALRLQILGDGPLRDQLKALADELGVTAQVEFVGQTDRVLDYLQQADVFVLPSRAEGVSNALLEAMACGLPVVVSRIPGNVDVVEHEQNGLLCTAEAPIALAQTIASLLDQPELLERLGRAARRTVENFYSLESVAERYVGIYQGLLSNYNDTAQRSADSSLGGTIPPLPTSRSPGSTS